MSYTKIIRYFSLAVLISYIISASLPAINSHAQNLPPNANVDRATREVDRSFSDEAEKRIKTPAEKPTIVEEKKPKEVKGPRAFVKKIQLEGTESFSPEEFKSILSKDENRDVSMEELKNLTKKIETAYLQKGVIAACYLPPQEIKDGKVILRVVEAKMGELVISDAPFYDNDMIKSYWSIKRGEVIRYDKMYRDLQLMNKNPDRDITSSLRSGKEYGTSDVLLDVKTRFPIHGTFSFDNEGSASTGHYRTGFGIRDNNFLFVDDTFLGGYTYGKSFSGYYLYHNIPITNFGTSLFYGYSDSKSTPLKEFAVYGITSRSQNTSFFLQQDLYKKGEYIGDFSIGMDANDKVSHTNQGTLNRDRLRVLRTHITLINRAPGAITYITPEISQGLHILGARGKSDLTSRGSDDTFSKFTFKIDHSQQLPLGIQANLKFNCQISGEKLASQEEFPLGGIDYIRGYPSQDYMADSGFRTNFELLFPTFWIPENIKLPYSDNPLKEDITCLLFFDQGYGEKRGHLAGETKNVYYASYGPGIRIRLYKQLLLKLDWGFIVGDRPITEMATSRFHLSLSIEDKLPELMGKIFHRNKTNK